MSMCFAIHKQAAKRNKFFVADTLHPQTIALVQAPPLQQRHCSIGLIGS